MDRITISDNEEYLRQISSLVDLNDSDLDNDILVLEEFCKSHEVMAMAAVQLGIPKRIVYLKNTNLEVVQRLQMDNTNKIDEDYNEARILINPVIVFREGLTEYWEACASCLDNVGLVKRPYRMIVNYDDLDGKNHQSVFTGFEATVLSHELDHLDGILHIDVADEIKVMSKDERKRFRRSNGYKIIFKEGKYEDLLTNYSSEEKLILRRKNER